MLFGIANRLRISIPDSVFFIGASAFHSCSALATLKLPYGLRHILNDTFLDCTSLSSVVIPDTVENQYAGIREL